MTQHNSQLADFFKQTCKRPVSHRQTIVYETKLQFAKADRLHTIAKTFGLEVMPRPPLRPDVDLSIFSEHKF